MQGEERGASVGAVGGRLAKLGERCRTFFVSRAGRRAVPAIAAVAAGFLFARTPLVFGAYPLGLALLCAHRRQALPCFFGVVLGASTLGISGAVWGVLYMLALLLRLLISLPGVRVKVVPQSREVFGEMPQLQVVSALVVSAAAAVYELMVSEVDRTTVFFAITMVAVSPLLTFALSGFLSRHVEWEDLVGKRMITAAPPRPRRERLWCEVGVITLLFFWVWCLRDNSLFGLNLGYLSAALIALYLARRFGALRGGVAGLTVAMAVSTAHAPAFGLLGLLTGTLWPLGSLYAIGIGVGAGTVWSAYIGGLSGFLGTSPEIWVAALVALPLLPRLYSDAIAEEVQKERAAAEEAVRLVSAHASGGGRIGRLSEAFFSLSATLREQETRPSLDLCRGVCDEICTGYCGACPNRAACWDTRERPGAVALETVSRAVAEGRLIDAGELPSCLISGCTNLERMLEELRLAGAKLWCRTTEVHARQPAPDYALTAELLREAATAVGADEESDALAAAGIRRRLAERGIKPAAVSVKGKRMKHVVAASSQLASKQREATALTDAMEEVCSCRLTPPRFEEVSGVMTMELHTRERYDIEVAVATRPVEGEAVSGDMVTSFRSPDGYAYVLLSDGMGTGAAAQKTAGVCTMFLEKMLTAGNSDETSLKLLNRLVSMQEEECAATIDLLSFDLCYGNADFMKSGAAASYIRREGNLYRMRSRTIPLGVVEEVDAERTSFETKAGDVIIMLSDGVSQTSEDAPWLIELLSRPLGTSLDTAAKTILDRTVAQRLSEGRDDDMTVILARVNEVA